jgi:thiosulfate/3-mercaptopyruvate sulfurtransferase
VEARGTAGLDTVGDLSSRDLRARPRPKLIAGMVVVLAATQDEDVTIINALLEPEYTGDPAFPHHYGRPGHIPSSVNVPFASVVDVAGDTRFVPAEELRQRFADAGTLDSERVITYCGGGIAASQTALLLTLLGQEKVVLYDGSMTDWGADPSLPLVTGGAVATVPCSLQRADTFRSSATSRA